mgnify:CR=1 FL=1
MNDDNSGATLPADIPAEGDLNEIKGILEAALLVAGEPVPLAQLAKLFDPPLEADTIRKLLEVLKDDWRGRKVELVQVASGWRATCSPQTLPTRSSPFPSPRNGPPCTSTRCAPWWTSTPW